MIIKINLRILAGLFAAIILAALIPYSIKTVSASIDNSHIPAEDNTIELPILMYHHMLKSSKLLGDYTITPTEFENDLKYKTIPIICMGTIPEEGSGKKMEKLKKNIAVQFQQISSRYKTK